MKSSIYCATILLVQFVLAQNATADVAAIEQSALDFQLARFTAMVDADMESLEEFLADELVYTHSTGRTESRSEFLSSIESGKVDYVSLTRESVEVRIYGEIALMTGEARLQGMAGDRSVNVTLRFMDVSRRVGDSWQLVAWQSLTLS